ncbi:MAG: 30S ribosomal protein S2 [Candidatus Margulisiibacteriota bacterium]
MRQLLESGVHFGHQTKRRHPKMNRYIFTARNGIHVIDLQQSLKLIKKSYQFVKDTVKNGGTVLFVGTKKQAQDAVQSEAEGCKMPYVNHRWLGGTLTNNITLRRSILKLKNYEKQLATGVFDQLSNKEASRKKKALAKLKYHLDGIKDMHGLPSALFIVDTTKEQLAIKEALRLGVPIIGVVDTNADPTGIQYPIPANDDAIRAIKLICSIMAKAVMDGHAEGVSTELTGEEAGENGEQFVMADLEAFDEETWQDEDEKWVEEAASVGATDPAAVAKEVATSPKKKIAD